MSRKITMMGGGWNLASNHVWGNLHFDSKRLQKVQKHPPIRTPTPHSCARNQDVSEITVEVEVRNEGEANIRDQGSPPTST